MYRIAVCEDEAALRKGLCTQSQEILTRLEVEHTITSFSAADERLHLTTAEPAAAEAYPEFAGQIRRGNRVVVEIKADPEMYMIYEAVGCLEKQDGDYQTIMLIADPGTEKETQYIESCGENGAFPLHFAGGYENIDPDADCTQKAVPSRGEPGERTRYIAEGK